MGCELRNFKIGTWKKLPFEGHTVEAAPAITAIRGTKGLRGVVYKLDGVFQGFTGSNDAVIYHVNNTLKERAASA